MIEIIKALLQRVLTRTFFLSGIIVLIFGAMWISVYHIQILDAEHYQAMASENTYDEQVLQGIRGEIYDRYGRPLAVNTTSLSLYYWPDAANKDINSSILALMDILAENGDEFSIEQSLPIEYDVNAGFYFADDYDIAINAIGLYNFLAEIYNTSRDELSIHQKNVSAEEAFQQMVDHTFKMPNTQPTEQLLQLAEIRYAIFCGRWDPTAPVLIARNISNKTQAAIMERRSDFVGFTVETEYSREYPEGELFAHIVGYAGHINEEELLAKESEGYHSEDIIGKTGIELQYEERLRGSEGSMRIELDAETGMRVNEVTLVPAMQGDSIFLTIDRDLQEQAYRSLYQQIKTLLVKKITGVSAEATSEEGETYSLLDIYCAMIDNGFVSVGQIESSTGSYASQLQEVYVQQSDLILQGLEFMITDSEVPFKQYGQIQQDVYNLMIESMRSVGHLSYDYQNDEEFYIEYAAGERSILSFFQHCIANGYFNLEVYDLQASDNEELIINTILDMEFHNLRRNTEYKKRIYRYVLDNALYPEESFLYLLYDEGLLSNDDGSMDAVLSGEKTILDCIIHKIQTDEITPANLNLDPCSGSVVLTDCNSGEVLAMVSYPSYDPNLFLNSSTYYNQIVSDNSGPLTFRALYEMRAIGSTYKMCTAIAGMELGYIDETTTIYDDYAYPNVNSVTQPVCWSEVSHGDTNVVSALDHSCNYFFYEVGFLLSDPKPNLDFDDSVGLKKLASYAEKLGLASKTGIEIGEATPKSSDQDAVRSAIGQGTNAFSAANVNRYTCTLANDGLVYNLYVVDAIHDSSGEVLFETEPVLVADTRIDKHIFSVVKEGMRMVVTDEHSAELLELENTGLHTAGKTGTAQESEDRPDHSYFTGYASYETPEIAITVVIPYGGGSSNAIPVFRDVVANYYGIELDTVQ
ncbi:MAG: hypothetical protein IKL38_06390 [Firmicutes bacterium]|nr:hypothetical protein [Bacillota bacterium]